MCAHFKPVYSYSTPFQFHRGNPGTVFSVPRMELIDIYDLLIHKYTHTLISIGQNAPMLGLEAKFMLGNRGGMATKYILPEECMFTVQGWAKECMSAICTGLASIIE